jgi:hypothetical protein
MARRRPGKQSGPPTAAIVTGAAVGALVGIVLVAVVAVVVIRARPEPEHGPTRAPTPATSDPKPAGRAAADRLLGTWAMTTPEGGTASLEFLPGGVLKVSATRPGLNRALNETGRWEVVSESGDRFRLRRETAGGRASVDDARFDGDDRLVIEGPRGGATYHCRK